MADTETTGKRVLWLRKRLGINQAELARRVNVGQSYISEIESDQKFPSTQLIALLADELDTSVDFLLLRSDDPKEPTEELAEDDKAADLARAALLAEYDRLDELSQRALYEMAVTLRLTQERRKTQRVIE